MDPAQLDIPHLGEIYALACALAWAIAVLFLRKSGESVSPVALNVFKNVVALTLLSITMLLVGSSFLPPEKTATEWATLLVSGALGIGVADTLFFAGLNRLGAGRAAIVDCFYSPCVIVCAYFYLGERVTPFLVLALGLVVLAVFVGALDRPATETVKPRDLVIGALFGTSAMVVMSIGIVFATPVLKKPNTDTWWATFVRLAGGIVIPLALSLTRTYRGDLKKAFTPGPSWRFLIPGAVIGTYISMVLWILGFKMAPAGLAGILNQTSTIFILMFATLFLREPLTRKKVIAIALGSAGALVAGLWGKPTP